MRKKIRTHTILFLVFILSFGVQSQEPVFKHFTSKNGLPSNETYFVYQDSRGYVWICTDNGISKYNANQFKIFNSNNGLTDNTVFEVREDKKGRMWFRSFSGKIGYIFNDVVHMIAANRVVSNFIKEGIVSSFAIDNDGTLWLGRQSVGTNVFLKIKEPYEIKDASYEWVEKNPESGVELVLIGENDVIYSDSRRVNRLSSVYRINIYDNEHKLIIEDSCDHVETSPRVFKFRKGNTLYISIGQIFKKIDLKARTIETKLIPDLIMPMLGDENTFFLGFFRKGVFCYTDPMNGAPYNHILNGLSVTSMMKDFDGGMWFSSLEGGVFYLGNENIMKTRVCDETTFISHMAALPNKELLVGLANGDVYVLTILENGSITKKKIYEDDNKLFYISSSICVGDKIIICGTGNNVIYDLKTGKTHAGLRLTDGRQAVLKKIMATGKVVYASTVKDIYKIDIESEKMEFVAKIDDRISALAFDTLTNTLYVGGGKGLYKYKNGSTISEKDKLFSGRIGGIITANGYVFVATRLAGLMILSDKGVDTLNMSKGLVGDFCRTLRLDKNAVWVSTNKGLSKVIYNGRTDSARIENYPVEYFIDPLITEDVNLVNGYVSFYSENDVYFFKEAKISEKERLYISSMEVNDKLLQLNKINDLPYDAADIKLSYEALFYKNNGKILYRYKIGKHWNYTYETSVEFPSLSPGEYSFHLEAMDVDKKWISADRVIRFTVNKPVWTRFWFFIIEIIFVSGLLAALFYLRYKNILRKEKERNVQKLLFSELETKAIRAQMNPHFIFNALNSIQRFILEQDSENAQAYLAKFSKLIRKMLESNSAEAIPLSEEIDILNKYIEIEKLRFDHSFSYEINVEKGIPNNAPVPFMMIQPLVENAIWHGLLPKKGERFLSVSFFTLGEDRICCVIDDNGVGRNYLYKEIDPQKSKSMALDLISQRLELLNKARNVNCKISITDKKDVNSNSCGTRVEIIMPILN